MNTIFLILDQVFLNHGKPMTLGAGNNASSPLPTESFFEIIVMFNNFLCWLLGNCDTLGT